MAKTVSDDWRTIQRLIRGSSETSLGTLEGNRPFVSATGYVVVDENPWTLALLLSDLSRHTRNIQKSPLVSLLVVENKKGIPIHERMRVTLLGEATVVSDGDTFERLRKSYLQRFPKSQAFFSLPDFRFYQVESCEIHWIGGFGKAKTFVLRNGEWQ